MFIIFVHLFPFTNNFSVFDFFSLTGLLSFFPFVCLLSFSFSPLGQKSLYSALTEFFCKIRLWKFFSDFKSQRGNYPLLLFSNFFGLILLIHFKVKKLKVVVKCKLQSVSIDIFKLAANLASKYILVVHPGVKIDQIYGKNDVFTTVVRYFKIWRTTTHNSSALRQIGWETLT